MTTEKREFGELFAHGLVRHSIELLSTLWGATICVLDSELVPHFPVVAPQPVAEMLLALLAHKRHRKEFELHFSPFFTGSPDWTGPRWFNPLPGVRQLVAPIGATTGTTYLLCVPFAFTEETEKEDHAALAALEIGLRNSMVRGASDQVPVLSAMERRKLQTHMSTLGREVDMLMSRLTRRSGDVPVRKTEEYPGLVGSSPAADELRRQLKGAALDDSPMLVSGELGSGRRTVCRTLHMISPRKNQPYVVVDCQTTPFSDLLSSLFGRKWKYGETPELERVVGGGTVVFHEVALLPPLLQQFILRYFDENDPAGSRPMRVIATASQSFEALENLGALRPEILALLRPNVLWIPPLRKRRDEIPALAADMLMRFRALGGEYPTEFSREALRLLQAYDWPGNLWELKGEIRAMAQGARGRKEITAQDLGQRLMSNTRGKVVRDEPTDGKLTMPDAVEALERSMLMEALRNTRWNRSKTARLLGVSRRNLIRKIDRYRLDRRRRDGEPTGELPPETEDD